MHRNLSELEQRIIRTLAGRDGVMRAELAEHVAIPTGHNHTPGLDAYRSILTGRLAALGAHIEMAPGEPRPGWLAAGAAGGSVEASSEGTGGAAHIPPTAICRNTDGARGEGRGPRVLLAGHLDTVFPPDGPFRDLSIDTSGAIAIGPGVVDMKGGILIAVHALEALAEVGIETPWTFVLNSDEEMGSYFSERTLRVEAAKHDLGIAFEPALPDGSLVVERKGSGQFRVEVTGRSAHAGREFEKGVSAVYALARVLVRVEEMIDIPAGVTINIAPISGGVATNIVPDRAAASGNARFPTAELGRALGRELDALASAGDAMPRVVVHRSFNRPAKPETPAVRAFAEAVRGVAEDLGQGMPFARTGGVCDGNILQDAGLLTLDTLGVRGGDLHRHTEWIDLASLVDRSCLVAVLLARLSEGRIAVGGVGGG